MDFRQHKAHRIQQETKDLVYCITKDKKLMSDQTRYVLFLLAINLSPEQISDMKGINLKPSSIKRMRNRYQEILTCANSFCLDEYRKHNLIDPIDPED